MLIRSLIILVVAFSAFSVAGQAPTPQTQTAKTGSSPTQDEKLRDIPFPAGVDLQFIIKELARGLDINVLFDPESFRTPGRKTYIQLKNVTAAEAIDYILLQEGLYFEEAGPKTILVANNAQRQGIPQLGLSVLPLSSQLAEFFGVSGGILVNAVRAESPAAAAGLKAGDIILEAEGLPVNGPLLIRRAIMDKKGSDIVLTIVRDGKRQTISVSPSKGVESVLKD